MIPTMTRLTKVQLGITILLIMACDSLSSINATEYALIYDIGTSARQIALGNIDGFSDASDGVFENPAGLYRINSFSLSAFSTKVMGEVIYTTMAVSGELPIGRIGFGFMQASVSDIPQTVRYKHGSTDLDNDESSTNPIEIQSWFDYRNTVYKLSYQGRLATRIECGINYVYYRNTYYSVLGDGSNFDLGVIYTHPKYETSFLIRNILPNKEVVYNTGAYETLPSQYILSTKRSFKNGVDIFPQIKHTQGEWLLSGGVKYTPVFFPFIQFMGGYKSFLTVTNQRKNNATVGIGLILSGVSIYYAYERSDYVLGDHKSYVSMTTNF